MKNMNTEIVAVGTELLLGQIANTNAQWISQQLAVYGMNVHFHSVVGDNLHRVEDQLRHSASRADIIFVTGGLGPTEDDLTREAFQKLSKLEIIEHKPSMEKIEAYFNRQQSPMTINNRKQARVFSGAEVIENNAGMAPGMIVKHAEKTWIFLPGVPREMKQMMTDRVIPYLQNYIDKNNSIKSTMLRFLGIGEAHLEDELMDIIQKQTNPTVAPLAQNEGVAIRLTSKAETEEKAAELIEKKKEAILQRVGDYFYGIDDTSIEQAVFTLLKQQGKMIGAAESLTGGMFTDKLISLAGASDVCQGGVICYDKSVKETVLNVPPKLIQQYGTVSRECAVKMAENIRTLLNTQVGISFTGVAGPGPAQGHQPGTVFIAICDDAGLQTVQKFVFEGSRQAVRKKTVLKGFELLHRLLKK